MKNHESTDATITTYVVGFVLSLILTYVAYYLVSTHVASHHMTFTHHFLIIATIILAFTQLCVQLVFFLHLGRDPKPKWNLWFFIATLGLILIIVLGAIWIMNNLDYNMTPKQINNYLQSENGGF